jgi:hypothetical protein
MVYAQRCPEVGLLYVVRNGEGKPLTSAELKVILDGLPKIAEVDSAKPGISTVGVNEDGSLRQHGTQAAPKATPALSFVQQCNMRLNELTLTLGQRTMRLIFNIQFDSKSNIRIPVIDSLPFQEGTFALDEPKNQTIIPARQWRRVSDSPQK